MHSRCTNTYMLCNAYSNQISQYVIHKSSCTLDPQALHLITKVYIL